ncbi:hypothetical protein KI688_003700 [Linnemannia hyalina]|uniref:Uncharacterized protein n=1 Tax=Linnemannia hyalina TaxID=64524 RepID=A0A9P8BQL1_9FUNG|nr:hypothetical protein KI688_003700 [Linnemannia hyalina]
MASISSEITTFLKEMELTKDLPSDAVMARFRTMIFTTFFFIGIQVQRITTCFTSTTFLAQLTFYICTVECLFKTCVIFGSIALLSFDKDFEDKMKAIDNDFKANAANSEPMLWFLIKSLVKLYRNSIPSGTSTVTSLIDAISADDQTVQDFPFANAVLDDIIDISCDLLLIWSMWQIVKDLEERNDRIAKARIESRAAAAAAATAAAFSATFKDEYGAPIYHVYHERGQQSSAVGI